MEKEKIIKPLIPDEISEEDRAAIQARLSKYSKSKSSVELANLLKLLDDMEDKEKVSGINKWFQPGTVYSIDHLPKHKAFFAATKHYLENLFLGGNRSGKTTAGAYMSAVLSTGLYPDWWEGFEVPGPAHIWACGQTAQTTRDTVQEALMGPVGSWGTGMIPADRIVKCTARSGIPGAIDTVQIKHTSGGISTIGFKSYDQGAITFVGTAKHLCWLDEPADDDVYNECLIRLMKVPYTDKGRMIHTITPKKGLTRLLADYLSDCDLLAGTEQFEGLKTAKALMDYEKSKNESE